MQATQSVIRQQERTVHFHFGYQCGTLSRSRLYCGIHDGAASTPNIESVGLRHENTMDEDVRGHHVLADHFRNQLGYRSLWILRLFTIACNLPPPSE